MRVLLRAPAQGMVLNQFQWPCPVRLQTRRFHRLRVAPDGVRSSEGGAVLLAPHAAFSCALPAGETLAVHIAPVESVRMSDSPSRARRVRDELATEIFVAPATEWTIDMAGHALGVLRATVQRSLFACNTSFTDLRGQQRLMRAIALMAATQWEGQTADPRLTEVAAAAGFRTMSSLRKHLSRHCNLDWHDLFAAMAAGSGQSVLPEDNGYSLPRAFFGSPRVEVCGRAA